MNRMYRSDRWLESTLGVARCCTHSLVDTRMNEYWMNLGLVAMPVAISVGVRLLKLESLALPETAFSAASILVNSEDLTT